MHKHLIKPLVLAIGLAFITAGCSQQASQPPAESSSAATPASAPADASSTSASTATASQPVFDTSLLSKNIGPCDDFNGFVNAKWLEANPIPADRTSWGAFTMLREKSLDEQHKILENAARNVDSAQPNSIKKKLGLLYAAGMDTATIDKLSYDPIKPMLASIDAIKNTADVVDFLDQSHSEGIGYVFYFGSGADFKDATRQIGYVYQGGLGLPTRAYYLEDKYKGIRDAYVKFLTAELELIGTSADRAAKQAQSALEFETRLAKASLSPTELRDLDNQYHFVSVAEADKISPHFSWEKFFKAQGVDIGKGFSLSQPKFIAEFDKLLADAPMSQWQAYLTTRLLSTASPLLGKDFRDNHFDFYNKTLRGQPEQKPRWKLVLSGVNGAMGMGLGELYVAKYFPPETKARAEQLVTNVRNALKEHIEHLDWMSDATKKKALKKWSLFLPKIGYPDKGEWRDWSGLKIVPGHWFANLEAAQKYNYHYDISKIGTRTNRKEWGMTPQTVNAYYSPSTNTINFPAAILQPPFFYAHGDDAINYGGIGAVIGHESSHGFDDQGSQFDGHGNRVDWWTKQDKQQFDERTKALVKQFNAYAPIKGKPDLHVNGKLTLGENIADLGGLNIAYTALQTALNNHPQEADKKIGGYTQAQRFFLSWARVWRNNMRPKTAELRLNTDPHSPAKIRAFAAPSDMPAFAEAFQCKPGSKMVRADPVKIW